MNVTSTAIAVALAVVIALAFLFFGPAIFAPFTPTQTAATIDQQPNQADMTATDTSMTNDPSAPTPTSLQVTDETLGTGAEAKAGDSVTVNYVGALTDGTVFDASAKHGQAFTFTLGAGQVIPGWDQGLVGMKEGGKRRLVIPASLAYGDQGVPNVIPPGATLVFEVELLSVKAAQ